MHLNDANSIVMKKRPLKARQPVAGEDVDRITLSIAAEDKAELGKIADENRVSIAWVIRDAITKYLSEKLKKSEA
jgi:hypothetical protein